ncbi:hypothetical protein PR202_gb02075 [Eleusine coracana subsp. coracana]|uniref:E2 ubiquitin-conjugating enzyme n=1 Tax=Eleusine coracana subsp. coracana TaxID=191504 RepID=A0AAV5DY04_ELECO|nr:hypothetical protein PR202_gb02075 [Eleusine coracana subsp. coracana]
MATHASKSYLCAGSSSFDDPDVIEVSPSVAAAGGWTSGHHKRKRSQVVPHEVIEIDADDEPEGVVIISEKASVDKNKKAVVHPIDWPKHSKSTLLHDVAGPSTCTFKKADPWFGASNKTDPWFGTSNKTDQWLAHKLVQEESVYNYSDEYPYEGYEDDYAYDDDEYEDDSYDASLFESEYNYSLTAKFDGLDVPGVKALPWLQKTSIENAIDTIFVRAYEDRMDLLRAVIMGPAGTPYHDGLFFFDIYFPPQYPSVPPLVNYRAGGLRLNPNLYACGKVCLSLLNTWSGSGCEKWNPSNSTMLQVLVSIQALVLNAKPYFNEPGYAMHANPHGEKKSLTYNEDTFLLSCRTMLYSLRNPPKNFEDFVAGHFRKYGRNILVACRAYLEGAQVGCLVGNGIQDVDEGDKSCSVRFKQSLKRLFEELLIELTRKGADCDEFFTQKARSGSSTVAADTTLRL